MRFICICFLKTLRFKALRFRDTKGRGQCNLGSCVPKRSVSSCDLRIRIVRVGFWQNGFVADFYFWAAGFFRRFCRRIFSPQFCGKKYPEESSRKIPAKSSKICTTKIPDTFLQRGRAKNCDLELPPGARLRFEKLRS